MPFTPSTSTCYTSTDIASKQSVLKGFTLEMKSPRSDPVHLFQENSKKKKNEDARADGSRLGGGDLVSRECRTSNSDFAIVYEVSSQRLPGLCPTLKPGGVGNMLSCSRRIIIRQTSLDCRVRGEGKLDGFSIKFGGGAKY